MNENLKFAFYLAAGVAFFVLFTILFASVYKRGARDACEYLEQEVRAQNRLLKFQKN